MILIKIIKHKTLQIKLYICIGEHFVHTVKRGYFAPMGVTLRQNFKMIQWYLMGTVLTIDD